MQRRMLGVVLVTVMAAGPALVGAEGDARLKLSFLDKGKPVAGEKVVAVPKGGGPPIEVGVTDAAGGLTMDAIAGGVQYNFKPGEKVTVRECTDQDGRKQLVLGGTPEGNEDCDRVGAFIWRGGSQTVKFGGGNALTSTPVKVTGATLVAAGILARAFLGGNADGGNANGGNTNGGNTNGGNTPAVNNPVTPPATPVSSGPAGVYTFNWGVKEDIRNSANFVRLQDARTGQLTLNGSSVTLTGQPPLPPLMGTWDSATQRLTLSGAGPLAGRPSVGVLLEGTLSSSGILNAIVTVGADGSLGAPLPHLVVYMLDGNLQPGANTRP